MRLLTNTTSLVLWQEVVRGAESFCAISLKEELEAYLVSLLNYYTNKPDIAKQMMAKQFLESMQSYGNQRDVSLQKVGDQCLLFSGLFPHVAEKRRVKISYFVDLGQAAYAAISKETNDLYSMLALHFVVLMDVLQSIRQYSKDSPDLLPIEAYEQWSEVGSHRAWTILQQYRTMK